MFRLESNDNSSLVDCFIWLCYKRWWNKRIWNGSNKATAQQVLYWCLPQFLKIIDESINYCKCFKMLQLDVLWIEILKLHYIRYMQSTSDSCERKMEISVHQLTLVGGEWGIFFQGGKKCCHFLALCMMCIPYFDIKFKTQNCYNLLHQKANVKVIHCVPSASSKTWYGKDYIMWL